MSRSRSDRRRLAEAEYERFLEGVDTRYRTGLVLRRRYEALIEDFGGIDLTSYMERSLAKRYVVLEARVEEAEAAHVQGEKPLLSFAEYTQAINTLAGMTNKLGLKRRPKPVKSLAEHIAAKDSS